jgi:hypothetical protein
MNIHWVIISFLNGSDNTRLVLERRCSVIEITAYKRQAMVKGLTSELKCVGHVGDVQIRMLLQVLGQISSGALQRTAALS